MCLIKNLPPDSATKAMQRGGEKFSGWGLDRYLRVMTIEAIRQNTHAVVSVNSTKKTKPPQPIPVPGVEDKSRVSGPNSFRSIAARHLHEVRQRKITKEH